MRSLRTRLILSHIFPLLIVIPIVGLTLIYLLQTEVFLAEYSRELEAKALLVANVAADYTWIWDDPAQAQSFAERLRASLTAEVMLLDTQGMLLASTDSADQELVGQVLPIPGLQEVLDSGTAVRVDHAQDPERGAAEVLAPVVVDGQIVGLIRLTDLLTSAYEQFIVARDLIIIILVVGLVVGLGIGWFLALDLARPLQNTARHIARMTDGHALAVLPEQGPEEIRLLLRAFNMLSEDLQTLESTRRQLLSNLVHELARPLGALLPAIQTLRRSREKDPTVHQELLAGMEAEVQRMRRLLDDLTHLYSQTVGPPVLHRQLTAISPWISQVLRPWREMAREKRVRWRTDVPDDLPSLEIDPDRMAQVLENIVSNAIKYTPAEGEVAISAGIEKKELWIRVRDTGLGIDPAELSYIFTPLYRGSAGSRFPQGMGLGLAIVQDLVQAHEGRIEVQSNPGEGSSFTIWLPGC